MGMEYILKKDGKNWIKVNLHSGKFEVGQLDKLLKSNKYYIIKEEELK